MSPQSTESVMSRFVEFINTADEDLAREVIAPDAEFHAPSHREPLRGPEGYLELIAMMRAGFPDVRWTLEETVTEGDTVAARFTMRGTHQGEFFGVPATGRPVASTEINLSRIVDGRMVEHWAERSTLEVLQQMLGYPAQTNNLIDTRQKPGCILTIGDSIYETHPVYTYHLQRLTRAPL